MNKSFGRNLAKQTAGIWHLNMNALLFATSPQLLSIVVPKGWQVLLLLSIQAPTALCQKAPKLHHARAEWSTILHIESRLSGRLDAAGALGSTALEAVGELAGDGLKVLHAAGTGGLSPLGLLAPVVCGGYVSALFFTVIFSRRSDALSVVGRFKYRWAGGGGRCATYTS